PAALLTAYETAGGPEGLLGFPTAAAGRTPDGKARFQHFQGGSLYFIDGEEVLVPAAVRSVWSRTGWEHGPLGYPTGAAVTTGTLTVQPFQGGTVFTEGAAGGAVRDAFLSTYLAAGGPAVLGVPTAEVQGLSDGKGSLQRFERGSVYSSPATGTRAVTAELLPAWAATGGERGPLGYPTTSATALAVGGGRFAHFQGGSVYWSPATGARVVRGPVRDAWAAAGWERSVLGYPTTDVRTTPDGKAQYAHFQGGSVYWTQATGARVLTAELRAAWAATGWERGPLGYPTTSATALAVGGGRFAHFQGGSVYWSPATGARVVRGPVRDAWAAAGWERSVLGYPTTDVRTTPDGKAQYAHFQGGSVYWTQATGGHALPTVVRDAWAGTGWERGPLGYPTSGARPVPGGTRTDFQRGTISVSSANGAVTVQLR
ncbi:LGFP repeat-containing protein, partial [Modestobacter sp. SYSU DS0511]